jgi:hypothetical protein
LEKNPEMKKAVFDLVIVGIVGIVDEGHAKSGQSGSATRNSALYLSIHIDKKKYPKYRVCQDGAAKVKGRSLNDELLAGPDLLNRLVGVLLRFRQNPIAVPSDVKVFFHQIYVNEEDSAVFRFFWYEDETMEDYAEHEMIVHTFGAKTISMRFYFHPKIPWQKNVRSNLKGSPPGDFGKFVCR